MDDIFTIFDASLMLRVSQHFPSIHVTFPCLFKYICVYICIYVYIYVYLYISICIDIYMYICIYMCIHMCIYIYTYNIFYFGMLQNTRMFRNTWKGFDRTSGCVR